MDLMEAIHIMYGMEAEEEGPGWEQQAGPEERQLHEESLVALVSQIHDHIERIEVALREIERLRAFS